MGFGQILDFSVLCFLLSTIHVLCFLFSIVHDGKATLYFSDVRVESYFDSLQHCKDNGGSLLTYGDLMIKTVQNCHKSSSFLPLWTALPWYNRKLGCFNGTTQMVLDGMTEDKHLAVCADFCSGDQYKRIGLWTTKCECYDDTAILQQVTCSYKECPLNPADRCGTGKSGVVYEKAEQTGDYCRYRLFKSLNDGGTIENLDLCTEKKPYICRVGSENDISCSLNDISSRASSTSETNEGLIVGLVVGIGLLLIVILGVILFIRFRKTHDSVKKETEEQMKDLEDEGTFYTHKAKFASSSKGSALP